MADNPAKLENHNNPFLHYTDDWYVLGFRPDEYLLVYYIGNNDAWEGYGGATVYTKYAPLQYHYHFNSASDSSMLTRCITAV